LETEHKVIVETYEPRSEMKISNGLDPNAIPVIDSNSVIENKANDKLHKNWFKFRIKGSR
jgi:hypothetical protein